MRACPSGRPTELERRLRSHLGEGRRLFVPYLTAGLPSPRGFIELIEGLVGTADAVEVGIPFSDPIMDGPVIQEASTRALQAGVTVGESLDLIRDVVRRVPIPIVVMTYFNPVHRRGIGEFVAALDMAGVSGLIVPDLPWEESGDLAEAVAAKGIAWIQMVAPTTPPKRARVLAASSTGFVYAVSRLGVTGEREVLDEAARAVVDRIRPHTSLPVLLGIGISTGPQARAAAMSADGVIVGSALMKRVLANDSQGALGLAADIRRALDGSPVAPVA